MDAEKVALVVPGVRVTVRGGVVTVVPSGAIAEAAAWNDVPVSFCGTLNTALVVSALGEIVTEGSLQLYVQVIVGWGTTGEPFSSKVAAKVPAEPAEMIPMAMVSSWVMLAVKRGCSSRCNARSTRCSMRPSLR